MVIFFRTFFLNLIYLNRFMISIYKIINNKNVFEVYYDLLINFIIFI